MNNLLAVFLAEYLIWFFAPMLLWSWIRNRRRQVAVSLLALGLAWTITYLVKNLFYYPRPFVVGSFQPLVDVLLDGTFPSGHAATAFSLAVSLYLSNRSHWWLLLLAALVGLGRVWVGVHFPADVIAGAVVGFAAAAVARKLFRRLVL